MKFIDDLESRSETLLQIAVQLLRLMFIVIMVLYLFDCLIGLSSKIVTLTIDHGTLDFPQIKIILTDSLFTMIVLAIVKSLFIRSNYVYAVTFLQIGFVVVMRKLILLEVDPGDTWLMLVLGGLAVLFFLLIVYANRFERKTDTPEG
ncbi:MAG: hypothetical protein AB7S65_03420 [Sulfuricurvum sp.]